MATGKKAFSGTSQASLISSILRDDPQPISQLLPMSPPALDRVVKTCLAKDPEERWQSAADLQRELRWIAEGSQAGVPAAASLSAAKAHSVRAKRSSRLAWALAALSLLGVAYLASELLRQRGVRPQPIHSFLIPPEKTAFRLKGDEGAPLAISPDGASVAFGAGNTLWVQSLRTGESTPLASTDGAQFPFWSYDGRSVGFFAPRKARTVEASGGPVQVIADTPTPRGGAWSRDRRHRVHAGLSGRPLPRQRLRRPRDAADESGPPAPHDAPLAVLPARRKARPLPRRQPRQSPLGAVRHLRRLARRRRAQRVMPSYGSAQYVPGYLLSVRDANLMASPFDTGRLASTGESVRVASDVNFDYGIWRGVFTRLRTACSHTRPRGSRRAARSPGSTCPAGLWRRPVTEARRMP